MLVYTCVLCASSDSPQWCVPHDLHFFSGRGFKRRQYRKGMSVFLCLPHSVAVNTFNICRGCDCGCEFGSTIRLKTFWCVAMGSVVLFIFVLLYSAWSSVNRVQVVLSGFSV